MARAEIAFVQLLWDIMNRRTGELGRVAFTPQKPAFDLETPMEQAFPRSTPEAQGVDSRRLAGFVGELGECRPAHMHQLMVLRHGHVIYEGGFDPYPAGVWHVTYSMCKSFTNMAIGLLIDEGRLSLEDRAVDLLSSRIGTLHLLNLFRFREITVRDLLVMSSGVSFNEVGAISGNDWVQGYFESNVRFTPGSRFEYNSMNSFILSAIVTEITGVTMFEFLQERIFEPMGIRKVFWEKSPRGITKGGWGMFITQEDAAKLGLLYLQKGVWNGVQLISKEWVEESTKAQIQTGQEENPEYGYHIWMDCRPGSFCYNGMLGQNVHVYPDLDMIIVTNAGNEEVFQTGHMTEILRRYFALPYQPADDPLPENPAAQLSLENVRARMEGRLRAGNAIRKGGWNKRQNALYGGNGRTAKKTDTSLIYFDRTADTDRNRWLLLMRRLDGQVYEMAQKGVGLFPLIMQVVHNNYTHGISRLRFRCVDEQLYLDFLEGEQTHSLPVGIGRGRHCVINMNGEDYLIGVKGRLHANEDGIPVMSLQIAFIEEATERELKILFLKDGELELRWDEEPGNMIITGMLGMITVGNSGMNPLVSGILAQISPELIERTMQSSIQPVVRAYRIEPQNETAEETDE
ncbi:MAG: serine hydrolase [Eubacteriales bacterium]|nr:serine hydrolase [Eubacteriales bacterium]